MELVFMNYILLLTERKQKVYSVHFQRAFKWLNKAHNTGLVLHVCDDTV